MSLKLELVWGNFPTVYFPHPQNPSGKCWLKFNAKLYCFVNRKFHNPRSAFTLCSGEVSGAMQRSPSGECVVSRPIWFQQIWSTEIIFQSNIALVAMNEYQDKIAQFTNDWRTNEVNKNAYLDKSPHDVISLSNTFQPTHCSILTSNKHDAALVFCRNFNKINILLHRTSSPALDRFVTV